MTPPLGPGGPDAQGVRRYGEDDEAPLNSDFMNLGLDSVSAQLAAIRAQLAAIPKSARGSVNAASIANGQGASFNIVFPPYLFSAPPHVDPVSESSRFTVSAHSITKDGCVIRADNWSPTAGGGVIRWEARGV